MDDDHRAWVIFGGTGVLGRYLVSELEARGIKPIAPGSTDVPIDDYKKVREVVEGAGVVVNAAAMTDTNDIKAQPLQAQRTNADGAEQVARAASDAGAVVVHVSTDAVFDGDSARPYLEDDQPNPQTVYARTKLEGELRVRSSAPRSSHIVRVTGLYGAPLPLLRPTSDVRNVRADKHWRVTLYSDLRGNKELRLDGERRAQPTWARAAAANILEIAERREFGVWHVSCAGETTWLEFASTMAAALGSQSVLTRKPPLPKNGLLENRRQKDLGLTSMPPWEQALKGYLAEMEMLEAAKQA